MSILVCGGAGYIGSHAVLQLLKNGEDVVVVDNLSTGHRESVLGGKLYVGDLRDEEFLDKVFNENEIEGVIHFAASSLVGESMENPLKYYENNVYGSMCLLKAMRDHKVDKIVFSSTAAVYGEAERVPIEEDDKKVPTNTYGETKLAIEKMLKWCEKAYGIKHIVLRYFNVAGASEDGRIGELHNPETHLIPIVLQVALGKREKMIIFGDDYTTKDGTCIRDYIHVQDLVNAHILAFDKLRKENESNIYNLGNGEGYSVMEVVETARKVTGHTIPVEIGERRAGDPAILIANPKKAERELNWVCEKSLNDMIYTAWNFYKKAPCL